MKGLLQLALLATLGLLVEDKFHLFSQTGSTIKASLESGLPAPAPPPPLPVFQLRHTAPGWWKQAFDYFDADHRQDEQLLEACQAKSLHPFALSLIKPKNVGPGLNLGQISDLYRFAQQWAFVNDPAGHSYFATAIESYESQRGGADDYAVLLASLLAAVGFETDIAIIDSADGQPTFLPEVCLGPMDTDVIRAYLRKNYGLRNDQTIHLSRLPNDPNVYLSLEAGPYPGAWPFKGRLARRLYLSDAFIQSY